MRSIKLAIRYARALFELAEEQNIRDEVFRDMQLFARVCEENRNFEVMLQSPVIRFDKKNLVIREIFGKHVHSTTMAYLDIITRKRREMIMPEIAEQYAVIYREWKNIRMARMTTAIPMSETTRKRVEDMLSKQLKAEIELQLVVKPELLGGFVLSVEDKMLDASIQRKIKKLTREFAVNIYERKI